MKETFRDFMMNKRVGDSYIYDYKSGHFYLKTFKKQVIHTNRFNAIMEYISENNPKLYNRILNLYPEYFL